MLDPELVGLFGKLAVGDAAVGEALEVPLQGVKVDVEVVDFIGEVKLTQSFKNTAASRIEAMYHFPVDEAAAVCGFQAEHEDGTILKGVCKKKEEARQEYQQAIRQGRQANLLESKRRDVFSLCVGNIPPGAHIKIELTYITQLKAQGDASAFFLPTYLAPRYSPPTAAMRVGEDLACGNTTSVRFYGVNMSIRYSCRSPIKTITCPSHPEGIQMSVDVAGKSAVVALHEIVPTKDIVLLCREERPHEPRASVEIGQDGSIAAFVTLFPSVEFKDREREFVALIDCSGSMREQCSDGRTKIQQAQQALQVFLRSLPTNCSFNIVLFGSSYKSLFPRPMRYDDETLKTATDFAKNLGANLGGTEIFSPLKYIFEQSQSATCTERQVFVVTDGQVWNDSEIFGLIKKQRRCRLFCLGVGNGVSHHLVEGMARAGRGTAKFVNGDSEELRSKVLGQLKQALQPALDDVRVKWAFPQAKADSPAQKKTVNPIKTLLGYRSPDVDQAGHNSPAVRLFPSVVPPIFHQERFLCYALFPSECKEVPESATVTAQSPDGPLTVTIPISDEEIYQGGGICHRMAARAAISEYEDSKKARGNAFQQSISKEEALRMALENGLVSEQTSFVAISQNVGTPEGAAMRRIVPQVVESDDEDREEMACNTFSRPRGSVRRSNIVFGAAPMAPIVACESALCAAPACPPPPTMQCAQLCDMSSLELISTNSETLAASSTMFKKRGRAPMGRGGLAGLAPGSGAFGAISGLASKSKAMIKNAGQALSFGGGGATKSLSVPVDARKAEDECSDSGSGSDDGEMECMELGSDSFAESCEEIDVGSSLPVEERSLCDSAFRCKAAPAPKKKKASALKGLFVAQKEIDLKPGDVSDSVSLGDEIFELCMLQKADGCFPMSSRLAALVRVTVETLNEVAQKHKLSLHIVTTIAAIAAFERFFSGGKDQWELQSNKALRYLSSQGIEGAAIQSCTASLGLA
jgi:hypothetical protein